MVEARGPVERVVAVIPIANLLTAPTGASVRASFVSGLTTLGIPAAQWPKGGIASGILTVTSNLFAAVVAGLVTSVLTAPFLPLAVPPWNAILALYVYGVSINPATYASGLVNLTNTSGSIYSRAAGSVIFGNSNTGQQYTNAAPFTLAANTTITGIAIQATTIGAAGSAVPGPGLGSVDTVVTSMIGVSVVNPAPILGSDADSPALVKIKCLASIAARSYKGPLGAYEYAVATALNGGQPVNINRWGITNNPTTGTITAYLAAPGGAPTPGDVAAVQTAITAVAKPMGITATAVAATPVPISSTPQTVIVWATSAVTATPSTIATAIASALQEWPISGRSVGTGGFLFAAWLNSVVQAVDPAIYDVIGFVDLPLGPGQVADITAATTFSIQVGT